MDSEVFARHVKYVNYKDFTNTLVPKPKMLVPGIDLLYSE